MITIDGSFGEGGGQILRTSLALSLITGKPFRIERIRAGRRKPGLMRQHLTCVRAAAEIGQAELEGDAVGSGELTFAPKTIQPGAYRFAVGTAGSAALVFQSVLPALLKADGPSELQLEGGTHASHAPTFDYIERTFAPLLVRMGARIELKLHQRGYYPAGGGRFTAIVHPPERGTLDALNLTERGEQRDIHAKVYLANLPNGIARREAEVIADRLNLSPSAVEVVRETQARGPGNAVAIGLDFEHVQATFTSIGSRGIRAEEVAESAVGDAQKYLALGAPVDRHLADQLLIPLAIGQGGSFVTVPMSLHTTTNIDVIQTFLDVTIHTTELEDQHRQWRIDVIPNASDA